MARFLGLDWDQHQLHILQGSSGRGGLRLEHATLSLDGNSMTLAQAETLGQQLRQRLKDDGLEAAPVLACIGRERVVVKEVRIPKVPENEEPALVRFQATKELAEADNVVIDYCARDGSTPGERRAFVVALRKDTVNFFQAMCKAAGLKLLTLTPRTFGIAAAVQHAPVKPGTDTPVAIVALAGQWAELLILRGHHILFSRALTPGAGLVGEVRRNLAAFTSQGGRGSEPNRVQGLYLAGEEENPELRQSFAQALGIPVIALDPFAGQDQLKFAGGPRGGFTPLAGLLHHWNAHASSAPINFIKPHEPTTAPDPHRRMKGLVGALAVVALLGVAVIGKFFLDWQAEEEEQLRTQTAQLDQQLRALAPEANQIQAMKTWQSTTVSWPDELYEVTAQFPWKQGMHVKEFTGSLKEQRNAKDPRAPAAKNSSTEKFFASAILTGEVPNREERLVDYLKDSLRVLPGRRAQIKVLPRSPDGADAKKKDVKDFALEIDLGRSPNDNYSLQLFLPPFPTRVSPSPLPPLTPGTEPEVLLNESQGGKGAEQ